MIVLCTDYASQLYTGQVHARIANLDADIPIINAIDDLPAFDVDASAYLLHGLVKHYPKNCVIVGVVDPGVGGDRAPICFELEGRLFAGPDNGLFSRIIRDSLDVVEIYRISDIGMDVSKTFHGRDVFAPAAVKLLQNKDAMRKQPYNDCESIRIARDMPDNLMRVIYVDGFGNCMTGIQSDSLSSGAKLRVNGLSVSYAEKFCDVNPGEGFWYINSIDLAEIAVNCGTAVKQYNLKTGVVVSVS